MAKTEQQRQKKLAKQKAKDRRKRQQLIQQKQSMTSLAGKMEAAGTGKIIGAHIGSSIDEGKGLGSVLIARQAPGGRVAIGFFLVDLFCLGVKDCFGIYRSQSEYQDLLDNLGEQDRLRKIEPGQLRGLVESSVEYAESIGLKPHADYRKVRPIFGDIERESIEGIFQFGQNGKPLYVNGPHEDAARQKMVIDTLNETVGPNNFHFMMGGPMGGFGGISDFRVGYDSDDDFDDEDESDDLTIGGSVVGRVDRIR
jgi:hypothetical protein